MCHNKSSQSALLFSLEHLTVLVWPYQPDQALLPLTSLEHLLPGTLLHRTLNAVALALDINLPIHFVDPEREHDVAADWLLRTRRALQAPLAERGFLISHGVALLPEAINLACAASLCHLWLPYFRSFMVGLRADLSELAQCDWQIVPTGLEVAASQRSVIAPWTSSTTLARSSSRLDQVVNLTFFSLSPPHSRWRLATAQLEQLRQLGVSCRIEAAPLGDLSATDLLVADCAELRHGGGSFLSPLVAAWRAGMPAILIDTEQERSQRASALDYLSITSPKQLAETVAQLQTHPQLYEALRQHAAQRARELRDTLITERWVDTLCEVIAPCAASTLKQRRAQPLRAISLQAGRWLLHKGRRPLSSVGETYRQQSVLDGA